MFIFIIKMLKYLIRKLKHYCMFTHEDFISQPVNQHNSWRQSQYPFSLHTLCCIILHTLYSLHAYVYYTAYVVLYYAVYEISVLHANKKI